MAEKVENKENPIEKFIANELADQYKLIEDSENRIFDIKANHELIFRQLAKKNNLDKIKDEQELQNALIKIKQEAEVIARLKAEKEYNSLSDTKKKLVQAENAEKLAAYNKELQSQLELLQFEQEAARISGDVTKEKEAQANAERLEAEIAKNNDVILKNQINSERELSKLKKQAADEEFKRQQKLRDEKSKDTLKELQDIIKISNEKKQAEIEARKDFNKATEKRQAAEDKLAQIAVEKGEDSEEYKAQKRSVSALKGAETRKKSALEKAEGEAAEAAEDAKGAKVNSLFEKMGSKTESLFSKIGLTMKEGADAQKAAGEKLKSAANAQMDMIDGYMKRYWALSSGSASTRLWGTGLDYSDASLNVKYSVGLSPWVRQEKVLEKLNGLIEAGVVYNLEERAFLATISDKIAATFDAFDSNLMRIIRLQQADTTKARMGLEAELNQFFGEYFEDTSYMNKGQGADQVSAALVDAMSVMTRDQSIEFEYTAQKWLGSLYSLGLSDSAIQTLAKGINMIATGDVNGLEGNESLQNLYAMAASRSGLSYAEMLTNGLNSSDLNTLLKSVVEYLREISENSSNQVVKAQYGNIFGVSISDLRAISNLTDTDISKISNRNKSYNSFVDKTSEMAFSAMLRTNPGEMIENIYENLMWSMGETIGSNPVTALTHVINKQIVDAANGKGMNIPFINAMGFGLDLNTDINSLINLGLVGYGLLGSIGPAISGLSSVAGLAGPLAMFGIKSKDFTSRGRGFTSVLNGLETGTSLSSSVGSASTADTQQKTLTDAVDDAGEKQETMGSKASEHEDDRTAENIYQMLFEERTKPVIVEFKDIPEGFKVQVVGYDGSAQGALQNVLGGNSYSNMLRNVNDYITTSKTETNDDEEFDDNALKVALQQWLEGASASAPKVSIEQSINGVSPILTGSSGF